MGQILPNQFSPPNFYLIFYSFIFSHCTEQGTKDTWRHTQLPLSTWKARKI